MSLRMFACHINNIVATFSQGRTMSELVEIALRLLFGSQRKREKIVALLSFRSGGALVDITDREALYQAIEGR